MFSATKLVSSIVILGLCIVNVAPADIPELTAWLSDIDDCPESID